MLRLHIIPVAAAVIRVPSVAPLLVLRLDGPAVGQPVAAMVVVDPIQLESLRVRRQDDLDPLVAAAVGVELPIHFRARVVWAVLVIVHLRVGLGFPGVGALGV